VGRSGARSYIRAMRNAIATLVLGLSLTGVMGQPTTIKPDMRWMINDQRKIEVTTTTRVQPNDSTKLSTSSRSVVHAKVTDLKKDVFTLTVRTEETNALERDRAFFGLPDSVLNAMPKTPAGIYSPLMKQPTLFGITRTGQVTGVQDWAKTKTRVHDDLLEGSLDILAQDKRQSQRSATELDTAVNRMIDSLYRAYLGVQRDVVNDMMAAFNYPLPTEGSERKPYVWKGLFIPGLGKLSEMPAVQESGCDKVDPKELVIRVVTTCDGDALLKAMNARTQGTTQPMLKKGDVSLVEESVYTFDRSTGWLVSSTTELRFRSGKMSARSSSRTVLSMVQP
jgi:hypothetical protein